MAIRRPQRTFPRAALYLIVVVTTSRLPESARRRGASGRILIKCAMAAAVSEATFVVPRIYNGRRVVLPPSSRFRASRRRSTLTKVDWKPRQIVCQENPKCRVGKNKFASLLCELPTWLAQSRQRVLTSNLRENLNGEKLTCEKLTGEKLTGAKLTGEKLTGDELTGEGQAHFCARPGKTSPVF